MKRFSVVVTGTLVVLMLGQVSTQIPTDGASPAQAVAPLSADDESAIRALVDEFANTWNRHDMQAMHELDTDDVEWINVVGHHWAGKATVYKGHVAIHKGMFAKTTMSVESAIIRPIAPGVAVAVATMLFGPSLDPDYPWVVAAKTRGSFTMVKRDGTWKIALPEYADRSKSRERRCPQMGATGFPPPGHPLRAAGRLDK